MILLLIKLGVRNAKRSIKDYIIYLITVTLAFSFIFAFNLISNSEDVLNLSSVMDNFKYVMYFVNAFIILVVCFLINYTTKFMFSKRSHEFGTYMVLGIKKKQISRMFTLENLLLGVLAFLVSIPIGYLLSSLFSAIIMNIFELPYQVLMDFSSSALLLSMLYFGIIYLIVLFLSRRRIKKMKVYDLLYFERQNENNIIKHRHIRNIGFLLSLALGVFAIYLFDGEFHIGIEPNMGTIFLCIGILAVSIYGITFTLADFILNLVLKSKKLKYTSDNLFVARTFRSKVKTMSFTLGTLTLLITLTLVSLNMSSLFKGMFDYQIELAAPYDINIHDDKIKFPEYISLVDKDYTILETFEYDAYEDSTNNILKLIGDTWRTSALVIPLSSYNQLLKMKGMDPVSLDEGEYLLHATREYKDTLDVDSIKNITLANGVNLHLKEFRTEGYTSSWAYGYGYIIVVPDRATEGLSVSESHLIIDTEEDTTEELANELIAFASPDFCEENEYGYQVCYFLSNIVVRGQEEANNNGFMTITSFVFYYVAFIFTAVVGTILAIQSLSDSTKYKYRYTVLRKLGVRDKQLFKTVRKQLLLFFLFPLVYPIIVSICTITSLNDLFKLILANDTVYLVYFFSNLILFLMIYAIYFMATYFGFKKNIME